MEGPSWEEKYLRLRDEHTSLTQKANEQDDTIRRLSAQEISSYFYFQTFVA